MMSNEFLPTSFSVRLRVSWNRPERDQQTRIIRIFDCEKVRPLIVDPAFLVLWEVTASISHGDSGERVVEVDSVEAEEVDEQLAEVRRRRVSTRCRSLDFVLDERNDHQDQRVRPDSSKVNLVHRLFGSGERDLGVGEGKTKRSQQTF